MGVMTRSELVELRAELLLREQLGWETQGVEVAGDSLATWIKQEAEASLSFHGLCVRANVDLPVVVQRLRALRDQVFLEPFDPVSVSFRTLRDVQDGLKSVYPVTPDCRSLRTQYTQHELRVYDALMGFKPDVEVKTVAQLCACTGLTREIAELTCKHLASFVMELNQQIVRFQYEPDRVEPRYA